MARQYHTFQAFQDQQSILEGHHGWATHFTFKTLQDQYSIYKATVPGQHNN